MVDPALQVAAAPVVQQRLITGGRLIQAMFATQEKGSSVTYIHCDSLLIMNFIQFKCIIEHM